MPAPTSNNNDHAKDRLESFFKIHNQSQLSKIDDILSAYDGDTDQLWVDLEERYQTPVPHLSNDGSPIIVSSGGNNSPSASSSSQQQQQQFPPRAASSSSFSNFVSPRVADAHSPSNNNTYSSKDYDDEIPKNAETSVIHVSEDEDVVELPSRAAVSLVIANDTSMKPGTSVSINGVSAVLEQERQRALKRAKQSALEMMKNANVSVKQYRLAHPHQSVMNDPSDLAAYKNQKGLNDRQIENIANVTNRLGEYENSLRNNNSNNNNSRYDDDNNNNSNVNPNMNESLETVAPTLSEAWRCMFSATPIPSSSAIRRQQQQAAAATINTPPVQRKQVRDYNARMQARFEQTPPASKNTDEKGSTTSSNRGDNNNSNNDDNNNNDEKRRTNDRDSTDSSRNQRDNSSSNNKNDNDGDNVDPVAAEAFNKAIREQREKFRREEEEEERKKKIQQQQEHHEPSSEQSTTTTTIYHHDRDSDDKRDNNITNNRSSNNFGSKQESLALASAESPNSYSSNSNNSPRNTNNDANNASGTFSSSSSSSRYPRAS